MELQNIDQRIGLKTIICTIPEPEPKTQAFWSNPIRTRPEVKKPYSSRPGHRRRRTDFDNQKYTNIRYGKVPVILMKNIKFGLENEFGLLMIFVIDGEKKATQQHMHAKDVWSSYPMFCVVYYLQHFLKG